MLYAFVPILAFHLVSAHDLSSGASKRRLVRTASTEGSILQSQGLNKSARELFERARQNYQRTYPQYGRIPEKIAADALSIDFEIETCAHVKLTPAILLERGGVNTENDQSSSQRSRLVQDTGEEDGQTMWPTVSEWFTAGMDGTGQYVTRENDGQTKLGFTNHSSYRQDLSGQIELESVLMTPHDALESKFTEDLQFFLDKLHIASERQQSNPKGWYPLPFRGSQGVNIRGSQNPSKPCSRCHIQWTPGMPLQYVSRLLRMTGEKRLQSIINSTDKLCSRRNNGCRPEYHAFVTLAAWALRATRDCAGCSHPKRCMSPWLVRTHFGDLTMHLKQKLGMREVRKIPYDVMEVGQFKENDQILPHGVVDYLRLPEMAELAGIVYPRDPTRVPKYLNATKLRDMPTDSKGLYDLSKLLLEKKDLINSRLHARTCGLHSMSDVDATGFKVKDWLDGLLQGNDLMSDHDSPLSKTAFSHMVWKSMGSWRMKPGSNRIYLECRDTALCLGGALSAAGNSMNDKEKRYSGDGMAHTHHEFLQKYGTHKGTSEWANAAGRRSGPSGLIRMVGQMMIDFEKAIKLNVAYEGAARRSTGSTIHTHKPSTPHQAVISDSGAVLAEEFVQQ